MKSEDEVRLEAHGILGFDDKEPRVVQGTGQITPFTRMGYKGVADRPDGWYLPDKTKPAIILETKDEKYGLDNTKWVDELFKNCDIVSDYSDVIGILYNGKDVRVFLNKEELTDVSPELQHKSYYINYVLDKKIDKNHIYRVTQRINNALHFKFGLTDLQDRMIFTACALVAERYHPGRLKTQSNVGYHTFHSYIHSMIAKSIENDRNQNGKLDILLEEYSAIKMAITEDQQAINDFIDDVVEIGNLVNSTHWNGEDVMAIFFSEFSRYKKKSDAGQVFTPDHITGFIYKILDVSMYDKILDATCGSGSFLVKAMALMMKEAGGVNTARAEKIKKEQLFGIELYRKVFALACANMLIHKDGKSNLTQLDAKSEEAGAWIRSKNITKVLMNPPYEAKYGCLKIVKNVMDNVEKGTACAFILPDKKLEKDSLGKKLLKDHTLKTIIKLPENLFFGVGVTTSIFIFEAGKPQGNKNIIGYYMEDDGLETVKNQGRHDVKDRWSAIETEWVEAVRDGVHATRQLIDPSKNLSYQMPEKPFEISEEDFMKTMMDYKMFERGIDVKKFKEEVTEKVFYGSWEVLDK